MPGDTPLTSPDTVIVLAQALTGLGHLRVSHALYHGLPPGAHALLLSSQDTSINYMHKITSINPALRRLMEFTQNGWAEDIFAWVARRYFRSNWKMLEEQLQTILEQHIIKPKTLLVVATHTNLAHQLAGIKESFGKKNNVHVVLVVVVTDDSPQHVWAVGGADLIFVPSVHTKHALEVYHRTQSDLPPSVYIVSPYLVSPRLGIELTDNQVRRKKQQVDPDGLAAIHMALPVSGAAVQLFYIEKLVRELERLSDRFIFHLVSQQSPSTAPFLSSMIGKHNVQIHASTSHRQVVDLYEDLYEREIISLEVTKPSEQSFKALLRPHQRGGSLLLFSDPVGRQEWDNVRFFIRHGLLPTAVEQRELWSKAAHNKTPGDELLLRARTWRGLRLPPHSLASAQFIWWCMEHKIFASMARFAGYQESVEVSPWGVSLFWKRVSEYLKELK
jgi:hypothetical protein